MDLPYNLLLWKYDQETWFAFEKTYSLMVVVLFPFLRIALVFVPDDWRDI